MPRIVCGVQRKGIYEPQDVAVAVILADLVLNVSFNYPSFLPASFQGNFFVLGSFLALAAPPATLTGVPPGRGVAGSASPSTLRVPPGSTSNPSSTTKVLSEAPRHNSAEFFIY